MFDTSSSRLESSFEDDRYPLPIREGCFKGSAVGRNRPKSATILATLYGVRCIGVIPICSGAPSRTWKAPSAVSTIVSGGPSGDERAR